MNGINLNLGIKNNIVVPKKIVVEPAKNVMADASKVVQNLSKNIAKNKESIEQIQKISDIILGRKTQFSVDSESGKLVVSIIDPQTNKVIKEIPSAEEQRMRAKLRKLAELSLKGSIVDIQV